MRFEFTTAARIIFGPGTASEIASLARAFGKRALILASSYERTAQLTEQLRSARVETFPHLVSQEPTVTSIAAGLEAAQSAHVDLIIGIGGGSTLDSGKAIAGLITNPGDPIDYLEVIGRGKPLTNPSLPYIAVPTTAGTGSEVTRNAVIAVPEKQVKVSLRSPLLLPRIAVVDPELTYSLPAEVTASTGLDALTQLIEPFTSNTTNPLVDSFCREGIGRIARSLQGACEDGNAPSAREDMSLGSLLGGLALANGRLGAVHGLAGPIGGQTSAPHGAICARLLPLVIEANVKALKSRLPTSPSLDRYQEVAHILTGKSGAQAEETVEWLEELYRRIPIRPLADFGLRIEQFPSLIKQSRVASSMKGNPVELTENELQRILTEAV